LICCRSAEFVNRLTPYCLSLAMVDQLPPGYTPEDIAAADKLDELGARLRRDTGISYEYDGCLEYSELGDAVSLREKLSQLATAEQHRLLNSVDQSGRTGVVLAAKRGECAVAEVLLNAGAPPSTPDGYGATALHYASSRGHAEFVKLLLRHRCDVDKKDDDGATALHWAVGTEVVDVLLDVEADLSMRARDGKNPVMLASARGDAGAVQALVQRMLKGPEAWRCLDAQDNAGMTAHALASVAGHQDVCELLESLGAIVAAVKSSAEEPPLDALFTAARCGDVGTCERLLKSETIDVETEVGGETALLVAASLGPKGSRTVQALLQARADPNHADPFMQETPLIKVVYSGGDCELLWLLLEAKADASLMEKAGRSAADIASSWGQTDSVLILRAAAAGENLGLGGLD